MTSSSDGSTPTGHPEPVVELDEIGEDLTADMLRQASPVAPAITAKVSRAEQRAGLGGTVPMTGVLDTVAVDPGAPRVAPKPEGTLSLEQYAWLYAEQLTSPDALAAALAETGLTTESYSAWRTHWESRMMHHPDERERFFALVARLRG